MDQLLLDYKLYYKARMNRYENDPFYKHSYQSEKALSEAMDSCQELIEFKDKLGDLNIKNAIALVKDQEKARLIHYSDLKEDIRKQAPEQILAKIDQAKDANEVVTLSTEIEQKISIAITIDGFIDAIWTDFIPQLETLEVIQKAVFPAAYENDRQEMITDIENGIRTSIANLHKQAHDWDPNWSLNFDLVWEHRHRKKIPLEDDTLRKRLNELKKYV